MSHTPHEIISFYERHKKLEEELKKKRATDLQLDALKSQFYEEQAKIGAVEWEVEVSNISLYGETGSYCQ